MGSSENKDRGNLQRLEFAPVLLYVTYAGTSQQQSVTESVVTGA